MRIESNNKNAYKNFNMNAETETKSKITSVFNGFCEKRPFINSVKNEVQEGFGAFIKTRREILDTAYSQVKKTPDIGIFKQIIKFFTNQGKGFYKGALALSKKVGPLPAVFAATGFCSGVPLGTSIDLTLGVFVKNLLKFIQKVK